MNCIFKVTMNVSANLYLFFCSREFELQVGCLLLAILQFLSRQLPLLLQSALHLTQLPLCLQQFGVKLEKAQRKRLRRRTKDGINQCHGSNAGV